MKGYIALITVLLVACAQQEPIITGTYEPPQPFDPKGELDAVSFGSEAELAAFVESAGGAVFARGALVDVAESAVAAVPMDAKADGGYSVTNVQVEGIDEGDIIKTDGDHIYIVSGTDVFIVVAGEDARIVSVIEHESQPSGIFIEGDRLAVFGNFYDTDYFREHGIRPNGMVFLDIYDVSDRSDPELLHDYKFEGNYLQSRMKDGGAYIVVVSYPEARPLPMPIIMKGDDLGHVPVSDILRFPVPYDSLQFATVHAIDLGDGSMASKTLAVESAQTVYMSDENIYIATTEYINEWEIREDVMMDIVELSAQDRSLVSRIESTDSEVLSPQEKRQKVLQVYYEAMQYVGDEQRRDLEDRIDAETKERLEQYEAFEYTVIHRLPVAGTRIGDGVTGKVPGHLNNQFALDEHEGYLRVATTTSQRWWGPWRGMEADVVMGSSGAGEAVEVSSEPMIAKPSEDVAMIAEERIIAPEPRSQESTNAIYVLDSDLEIVGEVKGIAKGEQIYSSRFVGERLYLVTFRQVDPFFVFDLSDPRDPRELGKLKLPGFSRYLHPYDGDTVIGIGRDATELGRQQGLKISLFDVSQVSEPREVAAWVAKEENSQSVAEWEHHAFLFSRERELLVIPGYSYDWRANDEAFNGAMVFRIARDEIELRGIIDHSKGRQQYGPLVQRSLYIDDLLYTLSEGLLRLNRLDTLQGVSNVTLSAKATGPYPVY